MGIINALRRIINAITNLLVGAAEGTEGYINTYAEVGRYAEKVVKTSIADLESEAAARRAEVNK